MPYVLNSFLNFFRLFQPAIVGIVMKQVLLSFSINSFFFTRFLLLILFLTFWNDLYALCRKKPFHGTLKLFPIWWRLCSWNWSVLLSTTPSVFALTMSIIKVVQFPWAFYSLFNRLMSFSQGVSWLVRSFS